MIAKDFARVRVLATESIATPMVEGARTRTRAKDRRILPQAAIQRCWAGKKLGVHRSKRAQWAPADV